MQLQNQFGDFPGDPVVKNPPCNARDTSLIPGVGTNTPHASEQLNPTTTEPACSGAHVPQPGSLRAATKDPACCNQDLTRIKQTNKRTSLL